MKELPEKRKVLFYKKKIEVQGRSDTLFIVEVARTKLKFFITVVNLKDPHDHQTIEMFRKVAEKQLDDHVHEGTTL